MPSCFVKDRIELRSVLLLASKPADITWGETEAGVCAVAAFDAMSAPAHPELA